MSIVIISDLADYHAAAVRWGLERGGFLVSQWEGLGYEIDRQASVEIAKSVVNVKIGELKIDSNSTVWMRRPLPFSIHPQMAQIDRRFARSEARRFGDCLSDAMEASKAKLINPPAAAWAINKKLRQLMNAGEVGMLVPTTLMGNDSKQIQSFAADKTSRCVYKGFLPHLWENHETGATAFAQTAALPDIDPAMLDTLTFAPGIYQKRIEKDCDIRVMVMGRQIRAFMIRSSVLDWRIDAAHGRATAVEVQVSSEMSETIREFMSVSGIVFGCLDFAVDHEGRWWFLEVNESGQFLWIDDMIPEAGVLKDFLSYLTGEPREMFPEHRDFVFDHSTVPNRIRERPGQVTVECA